METLRQDLRFALRSLRKSPGFAVVAILTLALAIGVNTSIFSLVSALVFPDLPMRGTETAVIVRGVNPELGIDQGSVSSADYLDLVERSGSFESLSALTEDGWVMTGTDQPERISGIRMTPGTTESWRLPPVLGRSFTEDEASPGGERVAMLTHGFWQDRFDADSGVLGRTLGLDGTEHTIVGVLDPDFEFASFREAEVIVPFRVTPGTADRSARDLFVSGRLAPGVSQEMAAEEVRRIGENLAEEHPEQNAGWGLWAAPPMESFMDDTGRALLLVLQLTVAMVILIACANVANMLLSRATIRAKEMAVRTALGAGRRRLVRQLLTESFLISLAAAGAGLAVAYGLNEAMVWISAGTDEAFLMAELNGRVLAFTLLVSLVAPMAFGLFPALRASGVRASAILRDGRSGDGSRSGNRARGALVTAQVSLALALMIVAGLLTRTVVNLSTRPLGYDPTDILTVRVDLPESGYAEPGTRQRFFRQAQEALSGVPGFGEVELASVLPGVHFGTQRPIEIEGRERPEARSAPSARFHVVSPGLLDALGVPVLRGRALTDADEAEGPSVALVSQEVADRFFAGQDPVGRRMRVASTTDAGTRDEWLQIVGVVGDVRAPDEDPRPTPAVYRPHTQQPTAGMYLLSRTDADPATAAGAVREAVWSVDPGLPVAPVRTVERADYERSASSYAVVTLFATFALFALVMAAVGIYGVMAYSVSRRTNEIGVRMALGAQVSSVRWMVLGQGARMLVIGIAVGLAVAYAVSRLLGGVVALGGVSVTDPLTFVSVPLMLGLVALAANLVPAVRATRMDPAKTLREG